MSNTLYTITPLEWTNGSDGTVVRHISGDYSICRERDRQGWTWSYDNNADAGDGGWCASHTAAVAACESHHRERVTKLLTPAELPSVDVKVTGNEPTLETDSVVRPFIGCDGVSVEECDALLTHSRSLERRLHATTEALRVALAVNQGLKKGDQL